MEANGAIIRVLLSLYDAFITLDFQKVLSACRHGFHQWYIVVSSPSGVWGGAPAANDSGAFWTKMEASGAIIQSTSYLTNNILEQEMENELIREKFEVH